MTVVFSSSPFSSFVLDSSRHRVTVSPAGSMERSTKAKSGSSFFERVLKGLKSPFRRRRDEEVVEFSQSEMEDFEPGLLGASPPPPEASFEDVPEEKQRKRKTDRSRHPSPEPDHKDHEGESSVLPQEEPVISSDPEPESSGHYHPSDLELEDLAFECGYDYERLLGEGCYGSVFKAIHRADRSKKAAIKCITTYGVESYLEVDGEPRPVLAEVAMMLRLGTSCSSIIKLHDWMENDVGFILIMEVPDQSMTLQHYLDNCGSIDGGTASRFRHQLLDAVTHCFSHGIFHGDLHLENVLVSESSLDLKVIDFGCALAIEDEPFESSDYHGNEIFCPPEIDDQPTFFAEPAYVWCLAAMFEKIMKACETNEWCYIIRLCLARDPADRLRLDQM
ncbi:hypothetical protein DNTS_033792 [Danionella cerebrum]|uniref:non-specific serine/threonine protein kinase n=1 Tax=Danionella cerebrum TaxID=2873325 RepID=A0A553QEI8_9TELE|nr:hypothetical protein DNTS_033792 [Danionella translucida]